MSIATMYSSIRARVETVWGGSIPLIWENENEETPSVDQPWLAAFVQNSVSQVLAANDSKGRHEGVVFFRIHRPKIEGTANLEADLDTLTALSNDNQTPGLQLYQLEPLNRGEDGAWYTQSARLRYLYIEQ